MNKRTHQKKKSHGEIKLPPESPVIEPVCKYSKNPIVIKRIYEFLNIREQFKMLSMDKMSRNIILKLEKNLLKMMKKIIKN